MKRSLSEIVESYNERYTPRAKYCEKPRRVGDPLNPRGYYYTKCNSSLPSYCSYCAGLHQMDYKEIIKSGLTEEGYKYYALTLTAPSFGVVHSEFGECACGVKHGEDDPLLGTPVGRYSYRKQVEWVLNFKKLLNYTMKQLRTNLEFEAVVAREWQRRGVLHAHLLIRVSDKDNQDSVLRTLKKVKTTKLNNMGWGGRALVDEIDVEGFPGISNYLVKGLGRRAKQQSTNYGILGVHQREYYKKLDNIVKELGDDLSDLARSNLGWSGHFITFTGGWSHSETTLKSIREERIEWAKEKEVFGNPMKELEKAFEANLKTIKPTKDNNLGTGEINVSRLDELLSEF